MDCETYVGFVHVHSARDGGHNDLGLPVDEGTLVLNPFVFLQFRVVGYRIESLVTETRGQSLNAPPTLAVDDPFIEGCCSRYETICLKLPCLVALHSKGSHARSRRGELLVHTGVAGARCRRPLGGWRWQSGP